MHPNILVRKKINKIEIEGHCRGFQTELDFVEKNGILVPIDTGRIVPHTEFRCKNTIQPAFLYYLAYKVGTDTTDRALNALFTDNGTQAGVGAAQNAKDGIAHGQSPNAIDYILETVLNDGGTEAEAYIEFYAFITGAATLDQFLYIGFAYANGSTNFTKLWSYISISQAVAANRRYHHYWKFTFAEA